MIWDSVLSLATKGFFSSVPFYHHAKFDYRKHLLLYE